MRCYICDVSLSEKEVSLDHEMKSNPCTSCNQIIMDTAYSDGFVPDDSLVLSAEDIVEEQEDELVA